MDAVRGVQNRHSGHASFHATFKACIAQLGTPAIYLEAGMGYKDAEAKLLASGRPIDPVPIPRLRALVVIPNSAVQGQFRIDRNIEIPPSSVLAELFAESYDGTGSTMGEAVENLSSWRHSSGRSLPHARVNIQAKRHGGRLLAVLQLR